MTNNAQIDLFSDTHSEIRNRIDAALTSDLSRAERLVLQALLSGEAFGMDKAMSIAVIQQTVDISDRLVKDAVKGLLERCEVPIGSCRVPGKNGYFLCVSSEDAEAAARPYQSEIFSMFRRLKALSPKSAFVRHLEGQMALLEVSQ